jgi:NADH-quinone oxidoreductase subunit N
VVSKAAGFALIIRFFLVTYLPLVIEQMPTPEFVFSTVGTYVAVLAALSMIIGNTLALRQTNIKRMMAYSGIAQAGYILVPFVVATNYAYSGMPNVFFNYTIFYLLAYLLMNLGAFTVIHLISQDGKTDDIKAYAGLYRRSPWKAFAMTVFMLSLAGIPLTAGFIGKFNIIASAIGVGYVWLGAVMIITSVISYYYYFGIVRQMYMREGHKVQRPLPTPVGSAIVIIFSLVGTLLLGTLLPGVTLEWIDSTFDLTEIFISGQN